MCGIFFVKSTLHDKALIEKCFNKARSRGPDDSKFLFFPKLTLKDVTDVTYYIGFHRLAINGLNDKSNQPFYKNGVYLIGNGEIYNYKQLYKYLNKEPETDSDCEIIIDLYNEFGIEYTSKLLDGVFAFALIDITNNMIVCCRDPLGVRPLFYYHDNNEFYLSSEMKQISDLTNENLIKQFNPGSYGILDNNNKLTVNKYFDLLSLRLPKELYTESMKSYTILCEMTKDMLIEAVRKRLLSDRPVACLLSGGLDSSLIASIVCSLSSKQIETFSIGLQGSPDLKYAKMVAEHLNTKHHEVIVTEEEFLNAIPDVIRRIESYDTTTVRASVGNCLIGKYISENSDAKVIFNGDGADELMGGYLYFHKCDNALKFDNECRRLLENISYFDVLRSDRCISSWGLEPRTPFLDKSFVTFYLSLPLELRFKKDVIEKKIVRDAFTNSLSPFLPNDVLFRKKEAFSDGVSAETRSWYKIIQEHLDKPEFDGWFTEKSELTKEQQYYKKIFTEFYTNKDGVIPYYWMPKWSDTKDPSARTL
tara:strand:- start:44 stop:1645 length:1602 start_codon:yes stop_codon:yes gene_type:complete